MERPTVSTEINDGMYKLPRTNHIVSSSRIKMGTLADVIGAAAAEEFFNEPDFKMYDEAHTIAARRNSCYIPYANMPREGE